MNLFFYLLVFTTFVGCSYKKKVNKPERIYFTQEERLVDLPLPIGAKAYDLQNGKSGSGQDVSLLFESWLSRDNLIDFYKSEMERAGWQEVCSVAADESVLIFQKPKKWACVTLRESEQDSKNMTVLLTCAYKNS